MTTMVPLADHVAEHMPCTSRLRTRVRPSRVRIELDGLFCFRSQANRLSGHTGHLFDGLHCVLYGYESWLGSSAVVLCAVLRNV